MGTDYLFSSYNYMVSQKSLPFLFLWLLGQMLERLIWPIFILFGIVAAEEICNLMTHSFPITSGLCMKITE